MAGQLSYTDALKILGAEDSAVVDFAEKLADGGLGLLGIPDFGGLRSAIVGHGRAQVDRLRHRLAGAGRLDRSRRLAAAHAVIVVTAFFEALDEELGAAGVSLREFAISPAEQAALAEGSAPARDRAELLVRLGADDTPLPDPARSFGDNRAAVADYHASVLAPAVRRFLAGLASWERLSPEERSRAAGAVDQVPPSAALRYEEYYRRLMADFPEFAAWNALLEHEATRERIDTGIAGLGRLLARMTAGTAPDAQRAALAKRYRGALALPVLASADVPEDFAVPTLEQAYLDPRGRWGRAERDSRPGSEEWAARRPVHDDVQGLLAGELTQPRATERPIVVLGQPGSGKSKLTEMLAARLPAEDFLPIRVELRSVPADALLQDQIEHAVHRAIGERISWPEFARSAGPALPVVILDGFDELIQAAGTDQADFLERVRDFQHREAELGRPLAAVVTTRTVVTDHVRTPEGCLVLRLEPFDDTRIARMLDIWHAANPRAAADTGRRPLSMADLAPCRELAEQPLMLLMLLIYDLEGDALRRGGEEFGRTRLYDELLTAFARREVRKYRPNLNEKEMLGTVESELRHLEIAALAMFLRRGQRVTAEELEADLAALAPQERETPRADRLLGRFFFVHVSRAEEHRASRAVYEFLHATFGEFLVARALASVLEELVAERAHAARRRYDRPLDDGPLYAVASFTTLAGRATIIEFLDDLLAARLAGNPGERSAYRELLLDLFTGAPFPNPARSFGGYEPRRLPVASRQARYTANLLSLLVLVDEGPIDVAELCPGEGEPRIRWRSLAGQWLDLSWKGWHGLLDTVRLRHHPDGAGATVERERGDPVNVGECLGPELDRADGMKPAVADPYAIEVPAGLPGGRLLRSTAMRVNGTAARMMLMLVPYLSEVSDQIGEWFTDPGAEDPALWSEAYDVLALRLAPPGADPAGRLRRFRRLLGTQGLGRLELVALRQAAEDLAHLDGPADTGAREALRSLLFGYLDQVDHIVPGPALAPERVLPVLRHLERGLLPPGKDDSITLRRIRALAGGAEAAPAGPRRSGAVAPQRGG